MNDYLLNQNLLITVSIISALAGFAFVRHLLPTAGTKRQIVRKLALSGTLLLAEILIVAHIFGLEETPVAAYCLALFCNLWLVFTMARWRFKKTLLYGLAAWASSLLLMALVVNNYYQYYPTLGALFTNASKKAEMTAITSTHQRTGYGLQSIEGRLYAGGEVKGTLTSVRIPGVQSNFQARNAYVYLPPAYNEAVVKDIKFPVLLLLTGTPGSPSNWLQGGHLITTMDNFASHHAGLAPIVVLADHSGSFTNDTECLDSSRGNAETYLTADVPAYMEHHYRVSSDPVNWALGGFSEGGMCAVMLALEHQNVFRHFLDMGGDPYPYLNNQKATLPVLFHGSTAIQKQHNIDWLLQHKTLETHLTGQFAIGGDDNKRLISQLRATYRLASHGKMPASYEVIAHQGHSFKTWSQAYSDALPKLSYYLGATECEVNCSQ